MAASTNDVIGKDNNIPWRLSSDLKLFKKITLGHAVIMGRKTYESIGKPLPRRKNYVLTQRKNYEAPGCIVFHHLDEALVHCKDEEEVFIIGGSSLYREAFSRDLVDRIYVSRVHVEIEGDVYFKLAHPEHWKVIEEMSYKADEQNEYDFTFQILEKIHSKDPLV